MSESIENELARWKALALYLADCQAATAEWTMMKKSSSKSEKARQLSICQTALDGIRGLNLQYRARIPDAVEIRLERVKEISP